MPITKKQYFYGWEFVKCYLSDDLASNLDDENQSPRAHKEAASNKKKQGLLENVGSGGNSFGMSTPPFTSFF